MIIIALLIKKAAEAQKGKVIRLPNIKKELKYQIKRLRQ